MLIDYLRESFGFAKYDPSEDEVRRYVTENYDYHERVTNLQYLPTEEEIAFLARNMPIQISGEPTEDKEVSNYKDLPRVETNFIRGGMCLIFSEGLAQKAQKGALLLKRAQDKGFIATSWNFLSEYVALHKKREKGTADSSPTFIKDIVAGRPVFSHPSRSGGFRFRYGLSRDNGFSAAAVHPATMGITNDFISFGTQLKIEKPTKGCAVSSCDEIDGPVVKLNDESVRKVSSYEQARKLYHDVSEILYLGDILIPWGDVANRNYDFIKPGYVEEWWRLQLKNASEEAGGIDARSVSFEQALELSEKYGIPLHPRYIYFWTQISYGDFLSLIDWVAHGEMRDDKLVLPYTVSDRERFARAKRALEIIGCEHLVSFENVVLDKEEARAFLFNLGADIRKGKFEGLIEEGISKISNRKESEGEDVLQAINKLAGAEIKDKAGSFIGARMGRPEKAKLRKLTGSPHVIFPVGKEGGRLRSFQASVEEGSVLGEFPLYFCQPCGIENVYSSCVRCGNACQKLISCPRCGKRWGFGDFEKCEEHGMSQEFSERAIDIGEYFEQARKTAGVRNGEIAIVKGVRGTSSREHDCEHLSKGFLRAKYNLNVNKDGTIRYDMTEMPLTFFKPNEIGTSVEKLRELGYTHDINSAELESGEQVLELLPHDIILPSCPDSPDERADDVFLRVSGFVDEELEKIYGLEKYYSASKKEDIIGAFFACIAPHICTATVGRLIGFSRTQSFLASPFMHAAMRRDCVHPKTNIFFFDEDKKEIFYNSIGDYVEGLITKGARTKKMDSFGTLSVENKRNIFCFGIDPISHEVKKKKVKYFVKGPETTQWVKITTATNREYMMTPTHKFMHVDEKGEFCFKDAKDAKVDDRLPVLENLNFESGLRTINLISLFKEKLSLDEQKGILVLDAKTGAEKELASFNLDSLSTGLNFRIRHKFSKHALAADLKIDNNLMRILGYYASEGHFRINKWVAQVGFRICNKEMQENLAWLIKEAFGSAPSLGEHNSKITICSKLVYYLIKCLGCGKGAHEKRVPSFIFGLNKELVGQYISAFFDGDGSVIKDRNIVFYSVSRALLDDIALLLTKFKVIGRYFRTGPRAPGKKVLERYRRLGKQPKEHILNHLILGVYDSYMLSKELDAVNLVKKEKISMFDHAGRRHLKYNGKQIQMEAQSDYVIDYVKKVEIINDSRNSYCVEIEWDDKRDRNVLWGEQIINTRCDGDECAVILLMDMLLNFSRKFLPAHRGGTQDAPLVLNTRISPGDVDDQILFFEVEPYTLEFYEMAEQGRHSSEGKIGTVRTRLKSGTESLIGKSFTHSTGNINGGAVNSSYKKLPTMDEKVDNMMALCKKIRAVDVTDVARLVIERHFIRDIRGNLRKFSMQAFRCVNCNESYRRVPLSGKCGKCGGRLMFTISEGSIIKYLAHALDIAREYGVSSYLLECLELTERHIQSIFGKEKDKQEQLRKWF